MIILKLKQTNRHSACRSARGLTAIEVIFSIFLISIGLIVYASSMNLVRVARSTKNNNIAYHAAVMQMEILRNTQFGSLPPSGSFSDPSLSLLPSGQGKIVAVDVHNGLKQITVTVSWQELGLPKQVNLNTLIYEKGINTL